MKHIRIRPAFILLFIILLTSPLFAEDTSDEKTVTSEGASVITGGNTAIARDGAVKDALRKAVEEALGTVIASETVVENFQTIDDRIYSRAEGYVKGYTIIDESVAGELYRVKVEAVVSMKNLREDLDAAGLLYRRAGRPRVLFLIAEKNIGRRYYVFWWWGKSKFMGEEVTMSAAEAKLKELFIARGFSVVDPATAGTIEIPEPMRISDLTEEGAKRIGEKLDAEIVVMGKALANPGPRTPGSEVGSYLADLTLQAVTVDTGSVIASGRGHGAARHISPVTGGLTALENAAEDAATPLINQIFQGWARPGTVVIKVAGISSYGALERLREVLMRRVRGVDAVYQRRFAGQSAVLEVETTSPSEEVAESLTKADPSFRIIKTTPRTIELVLE